MPYPKGAIGTSGDEPVAADLMPQEDFSAAGIAKRRWDEIDSVTRNASGVERAAQMPVDQLPRGAAAGLPYLREQSAKRLRELTKSTQAQDLSRYPELQKAVISAIAEGAPVREEDIARLINVKEATRAAKMLLAASAIGDEQRQKNILATADPTMRAAIYDIADNLIAQYKLATTPRSEPQKAGFDAVANFGAEAFGNTLNFVGSNLGAGAGSTLAAMEAGWEVAQQTWRAGVLVDDQVLGNPITPWFVPARVPMNWGKTGKGSLNEGYIQSLKDSGQYSPVAVDILADISRAKASGDPEPIITVMTSDKYAGNAEADSILRRLIYREESDASLDELARQIDSANQGSAGQILNAQIGSIGANPLPGQDPIEAYSPARGSVSGEIGANVANFTIGMVADPFLGLSKVRGAYLGVRYALNKLAPGMDVAAAFASKKIAGIETNATRIFFQRFVDDLAKLDDLEKSDKVAAGAFRQVMARQFKDLPDDVIEEFRLNGVRTVDDVVDLIHESNGMFKMLNGEVADEAAALLRAEQRAAATPMQRESLFGRIMESSGNTGRREALMPRLTLGGILRQDAARLINSRFMPSVRAEAVIQSSYSDLDPTTIANSLNDNYKTIGKMDASRVGVGRGGAFADRLTRMLSSLPSQSFIRIDSSADAGTFYKMARTFLTKRHADVLTEAFREANPGQRRLLIAGVVRSSAASRGVNLSKEEVLAKIDELVTGGMEGEQYAASHVIGPAVAASSASDLHSGLIEEAQSYADEVGKPLSSFQNESELAAALYNRRAAKLADQHPELTVGEFPPVRKLDNGNWFIDTANDEALAAYMQLYYPNLTDDTVVTIYRGMREGEVPMVEGGIGAPTGSKISAGGIAWWTYNPAVAAAYATRSGKVAKLEIKFGELKSINQSGAKGFIGPNAHAQFGLSDEIFLDYTKVSDDIKNSVSIVEPAKVGEGGNALSRMRDISTASPMKIISDLESTTTYNPAIVNGQQHALHNYQVAKAVAIPSIADIEAIKAWRSTVPEWVQNAPQTVTDIWSLGTLYGFRFSQRSMIEDMWAYAITGGSLPTLFAGRKASTAIREATPVVRLATEKVNGVEQFVRDADGNLKIIVDSRLGMFNKRLRGIAWKQQKAQNDNIVADVLGQFFINNLDEDQIIAAFAASRTGNMQPLQELVQLAFAKQIIKVAPEQQKYILRLVGSPTGMRNLNDFAETGRFLNQGTTPKVTGGVPGSDLEGVQLVTVPEDARTVFGKFMDVPMDGTNRYGNMFWHRNLLAAVEYDGPIGKIAVANLYNKETAVQKIVDAINADKRFGYKDNFSMLYTGAATVEEFARRYFDDVYGMFAGKNGINRKLWEKIVREDENGKVIVSMYGRDEDGNKIAVVTQEMLGKFKVEEKPTYVLGREVNAMPTAVDDNALLSDKAWGWMGEQYARISKEPIFLANYIEQSEFLQPFEKQLAEQIGEKAAARLTTKWAEDRAYAFSLNYTDNPMNRSVMAWKVRNFARYYRATEDFYRRMGRVAKNYPVGFWRTALTYQLLDETGFVYTDENGEKYFAYPGNEFLMTSINKVLSVGLGRQTAAAIDPFFVGGKVSMLAPSSDPKQWLPTMSGPVGVIGFKMLFDRFDSLQQFEKYITGEYSVNASYWDAILPASINRVLKSASQDERDSLYGSAMMDSMAIAAANDMIPEGMTTVDDIKNSDLWPVLNNIATGIVVTKLLMSYFVPASPQVYTDNVTAFARANGLSSMRQAFLALVQKYAESDIPAESMNPMGAAMRKWYSLHPQGNIMPFTVSKTENRDIVANLANVQATDKMESWYRDNKWLWKKYPKEAAEAALWLAPRDGEFSWDAWQLTTNELGLKQGKDFNTFARDVLASKTQFEYFATIDDYAVDIAAQDPRTAEGRAEITKLEAERKLDLDTIANGNPFFLDKDAETNWSKKDRHAQVAFDKVKAMVSEMYKNGDATETSNALYNAILTYEDYMADIRMITGTTNADDESKRQLRYEMTRDLEALAANNLNVAQFVQTVLRRTPDFVALSTSTGGMN